MAGSLTGIAVLDLTQHVAGPYCTKLLAMYGAEVIKVEPPGMGDSGRSLGPFVHDEPHPEKSIPFLYLNTSKKSITLDIQTQTGRKLLRQLVKDVDVLVENFPPSALPSLGLGYEALSALNPRLVMTSITYFGQTGPYRDFKGADIIGQALSGHLQINGEPDREPVMVQGNFAQYTGGQAAYVATLMALYYALASGEGQRVDASIAEAHSDMLDSWGINSVFGTKEPRTGINHHGVYPGHLYPCKDGYVALGTGPGGWKPFAELIGREELFNPNYENAQTRMQYRDEIDPIIKDWLREKTRVEVYHAGQARRMPFTFLMTSKDMLESPQLQAREYFQEIDHPATGPVQYPGPPFGLSGTAVHLTRAPLLGEHNEAVYTQRLGLTKQELLLLRQQGII